MINIRNGRRLVAATVLLSAAHGLSGCTAAPTLFAVATTAYGGYSQYHVVSGSEVSFEYDKSDPAPEALRQIRDATRIVIYPTGLHPGQTVDALRDKTDLTVVSSTKTTAWIEKRGVQDISAVPRLEQRDIFKGFGRVHDADLVLITRSSSSPKTSGSQILFNMAFTTTYTTVLFNPKGDVLWSEEHKLRTKAGTTEVPAPAELESVLAMGIADRLMELRRDKADIETAEDETGLFGCEGLLSFAC